GDDVAEIKHAPGVAGVVGDVRAGHVTALDDQAGIVGADGGPEHRAAAPRADDAPRVVTGRRSESGAPIELGGLSGPPRPPTGRRSESGGRGSGSGGQRESRERPHGQAAREGHCSGSPVFMRGTRSGAPGRTPPPPPTGGRPAGSVRPAARRTTRRGTPCTRRRSRRGRRAGGRSPAPAAPRGSSRSAGAAARRARHARPPRASAPARAGRSGG